MSFKKLENISKLFKIIMREHTEMSSMIDSLEKQEDLSEIIYVFVKHMRDEEFLMIQCEYPDFEKHRMEHISVIGKLVSYARFPVDELKRALRELFIHHINEFDFAIYSHLVNEGVPVEIKLSMEPT